MNNKAAMSNKTCIKKPSVLNIKKPMPHAMMRMRIKNHIILLLFIIISFGPFQTIVYQGEIYPMDHEIDDAITIHFNCLEFLKG